MLSRLAQLFRDRGDSVAPPVSLLIRLSDGSLAFSSAENLPQLVSNLELWYRGPIRITTTAKGEQHGTQR